MRISPALAILVVFSFAMAGCGGKTDEPTPTGTTSPAPTTGATTSPTSTTSPTAPPPSQPKEVLNTTMKYQPTSSAQGGEEKPFKIDAGYTQFEVRAQVVRPLQCGTLQAEPGQQKPNATFFPPSTSATLKGKLEFETVGPVACGTDTNAVIKAYTGTFPAGAGDWKVKLYGTGNVDVKIVVTALP